MTKKLYAKGTLHRLFISSKSLENNKLEDPSTREVIVYIPANHTGEGLALITYLAAFTSSGLSHANWRPFGENLVERLDRLIATKAMQPAVVAMPDAYTRLGGNQYINSFAMGDWSDFLRLDMVPYIEQEFNCGGDGRRALVGKSSGGYGSLVNAMLYPEYWSAAACHSSDMGFDLMYPSDFPIALRQLADFGGSDNIKQFIANFEASDNPRGEDIHALMILAMCATYNPCEKSYFGIKLPVNEYTCELIPELWQQWLKWDPLSLVKTYGDNLKKLKGLYLDCGDKDQYNLLYGHRRLHVVLNQQNIKHSYEEFSGTHSKIDHRLDGSLVMLSEMLK